VAALTAVALLVPPIQTAVDYFYHGSAQRGLTASRRATVLAFFVVLPLLTLAANIRVIHAVHRTRKRARQLGPSAHTHTHTHTHV